MVSNHGGRQLDGTVSSIRALPEVKDAVGDKLEVFFDGGVRSGQDVLKALALGARGVFIGKAFAWALGAMGEQGVSLALEIIRKELDASMALCGIRDVKSGPILGTPDGGADVSSASLHASRGSRSPRRSPPSR